MVVLVLLLFLAVFLFYDLQKYIVTTNDGVSLELPFLERETETAAAETAAPRESAGPVELVVEDPDYSGVETGAGEDLRQFHGYFIPADSVTAASLTTLADVAKERGADTLVLEMKPASGQLIWASQAPTAVSYDTAGTRELEDVLADLHEQGFTLCAQISVCTDDLITSRNPGASLQTEDGEVYSDSVGAWLDPYNSFVRTYIDELMEELHGMGFSEVVLAHLSHPVTSKTLVYSTDMTGERTPVGAVSSLAVRLGEDAEAMGLTVSVLLEAATLTGDADATGQDQELFYRVFDRLCVPAAEEQLSQLRSEAEASLGRQDTLRRFVPVVTTAPATGSWLIDLR